jgi:hypothetical protein
MAGRKIRSVLSSRIASMMGFGTMPSCARHSMSMAVIATLALPPAAAQAGQIWFGGMDPVTTADRERVGMDPPGTYAANDFMNLFRPNAPWTRAASTIQEFHVSTQFLHRSTDEQLSTVISDLRRRHIALGFEAEIMADDPGHPCGAGIPGHTSNAVIRTVVDRVARLGGKIEYVSFDEPVAFGHYNINRQSTACNYTIDELVRNIAPQIELIKTAFPDVKFGDGEPVNGATIGKMDDNLQFAKEFFRQTGVRLSFMDADIIWFEKTFRSQLVEWPRRLHEAGMEYGVIIDGSAVDKSDLEWTRHAIERYWLVTNDPAIKPDNYIFASWMRYPARYLPETQPGTFTSVVVQTVGMRGK